MLPIKQEFIKVAKMEHKELGFQLTTLNRFSVLGGMSKRDFDRICEFLERIGLKFYSDGKDLIWISSLSKTLQKVFKRQNKL